MERMPTAPMPDTGMRSGYPKERFSLLLVVMALLIAIIIVTQWAASRGGVEPTESQAALEGNIHAYQWQMPSTFIGAGTDEMQERTREQSRRNAILRYEQALREAPSADVARRLIITQYPAGRPQAIELLQGVMQSRAVDTTVRATSDAEIAMWREIYISEEPLAADRVSAHELRIRELNLGWFEHLALADLYDRAGMADRASAERSAATAAAGRVMGMITVVVIALSLLGLLGVVLLIGYIARRRRRSSLSAEVSDAPPEARSAVAGYLLEAFVIYLAAVIFTQILGAVVLVAIIMMLGIREPSTALLAPGMYVFSGLLAVAYLSWRLKSVGWSWRLIGLSSRDPLRDILWGIGGYAAALPLLVVALAVSQVIGRYVEAPTHPVIPLVGGAETLIEQLALLTLVAVAAPVVEEVFFRGVLFSSIRAKWGLRAGIVLSALIFAVVHPLPVGFLPIAVLGAVFAVIVHERKSLLPAIVAHALNNSVAFAFVTIMTQS